MDTNAVWYVPGVKRFQALAYFWIRREKKAELPEKCSFRELQISNMQPNKSIYSLFDALDWDKYIEYYVSGGVSGAAVR